MAILSIRARRSQIIISNPDDTNQLDVSAVLHSLVVSDEMISPNGYSKVTGTLTLFANPVTALSESLDPRDNPTRFGKGMKITVQVADSTGTLQDHPRSPLFILKRPAPAPYDANPATAALSIQVGCALALTDYRQSTSDDSEIDLGTSKSVSTIITNYLNAADGPDYSGDITGSFDYPLPRLQGSAANFVGQLAMGRSHLLFMRGDTCTSVNLSDALSQGNNDLKLRLNPQYGHGDDVRFDFVSGSETPAETVRVVSSKKDVEEVTDPPIEISETFNPRTWQKTDTDIIYSPPIIRKTIELKLEARNIFPVLEERGSYSHLKERSFSEQTDYFESDGGKRLLKTVKTLLEPRGIIAPLAYPVTADNSIVAVNAAFVLAFSERQTTRYLYRNDATVLIETTYEVAEYKTNNEITGISSFVPVVNRVESRRWRQMNRSGTTWEESFVTTYKEPIVGQVQDVNPNSSPTGINSQPPAPTRAPERYSETTEQIVGEAKFSQGAGSEDYDREKEYRLNDGMVASEADADQVAEVLGKILQGRDLGARWITDLDDWWFENDYLPCIRVDWADFRKNKRYRYLSNGHTFTITQNQVTWGADGIYLGEVTIRNSAGEVQSIDADIDIVAGDTVATAAPFTQGAIFGRGGFAIAGNFVKTGFDVAASISSIFGDGGFAFSANLQSQPRLSVKLSSAQLGLRGVSDRVKLATVSFAAPRIGVKAGLAEVKQIGVSFAAPQIGLKATILQPKLISAKLALPKLGIKAEIETTSAFIIKFATPKLRLKAVSELVSGVGPPDLYSLPTTTNLALWVNAQTDVTLTGSDVTQWTDQSSSARNITPNSSEPIVLPAAYNGLDAIEQVATGGQWNFPIISASNSWTVFLVYDKTQTGQFFLKGSSNSFYFEIQNSLMRYAGGANVNGSLTPTSSSGLGVYEWVVNAGSVTLLQNGNVRGTGTAATAFAIDRAMAPISFTNSQGAVTDLIIYTSALSSGDRTTIRNALADRYGL